MNIKPQSGRRNYAKGGTVWPDASSPYAEGLPISGGSANLPGGTMQIGGAGGVYDPEHPERGAQGASTFYEPAVGASTYYSAAVDKALREKNRHEQGG